MGPFSTIGDLAELRKLLTAGAINERLNVIVFDPEAPSNAEPRSDMRHARFSLTLLLAWLVSQDTVTFADFTTPTLTTPIIDDTDTGVTITSANQTHAAPVVTIPDIGDAADTFVMLQIAQELLLKTLTGMVVKTGLTASGSAANNFSGSTGAFLTSTGLTTISGGLVGSIQALSGAGAVNVTTHTTNVTSTGADALTLADGTNGQLKTIRMVVDGGDATLTPTTKTGYSTIVFNDIMDTVVLQFLTTLGWCVVSNSGCTIA